MKEIENTLKHLHSMAQMVPAPFYWLDLEGKFTGVNEWGLKAIGTAKREHVIGRTVYELYKNEDVAAVLQEDIIKTIKTGITFVGEDKIIDIATGKYKYFNAIRAPLYDNKNKIYGIIGASIEITDKKETSEVLTPLLQKSLDSPSNTRITNRELMCLKLLKEGFSSKQIAPLLNISYRTVEQYIDIAKNKLGCKNSVELIYKCLKNGILQ